MSRFIRYFSACLLLHVSLLIQAQPWFKRVDTIPVIENGIQQQNPWAGGLNSPQFGEIDLNLDGIKDLIAFDRTGDKIYPFLNGGKTNTVDYRYAHEYATRFPNLSSWVLLADYNCDGKEDIFTWTNGGIKVYKNSSSALDGLRFVLEKKLLYTHYPSILPVNLYVSPIDYPAITDVDGDGDLDILTFQIIGTQVEYHKNQSKELYGHCDSLVFDVMTSCWGNFAEDPNNCTAYLGACKGVVAPPDNALKTLLHTGSSLLALDLDCDNDKDMIVGDVSCNHLYSLINGGDIHTASITAIDTLFPRPFPVDMTIFPAVFYLDVDNDGLKDLISSPNSITGVENFTSVWWYKNTGSNCAPVWVFKQQNFLQEQMIETGEGAYPAFFDYNGDGLKDLVIGTTGYFDIAGYQSKMALYKNTGTATNPAFELITRDYADVSSFNLSGTAPCFGDLDGDEDEDMIIGDQDGFIHYFENTAGKNNTANFVLKKPKYTDSAAVRIDVGQAATPQIIDINRDGKNDLIIGGANGKIRYYENIGTLTVPLFAKRWTSLQPDTLAFGGVNVTKKGVSYNGYATPLVANQGGVYKILVGSEQGYLYLYDNIEGNLKGKFNLVDSMYMNAWEGVRTSITGADIDNDGWMDVVIGNYCGGVSFYRGVSTNPVGINESTVTEQSLLRLFPNPADDIVTIELPDGQKSITEVEIFNVLGKSIQQLRFIENKFTVTLQHLETGIYFFKCTSDKDIFIRKVQVVHQ